MFAPWLWSFMIIYFLLYWNKKIVFFHCTGCFWHQSLFGENFEVIIRISQNITRYCNSGMTQTLTKMLTKFMYKTQTVPYLNEIKTKILTISYYLSKKLNFKNRHIVYRKVKTSPKNTWNLRANNQITPGRREECWTWHLYQFQFAWGFLLFGRR